jgi:hypothetical protein
MTRLTTQLLAGVTATLPMNPVLPCLNTNSFVVLLDGAFSALPGLEKFSRTNNISYLYTSDALDWTIFILYFGLLFILAVYGAYRLRITYLFLRYHQFRPQPKAYFDEDDLPHVTIQLPLFNEMYVVERLLAACAVLDYPKDKLEIQSWMIQQTKPSHCQAAVERYAAQGLDMVYLHRTTVPVSRPGHSAKVSKWPRGSLF